MQADGCSFSIDRASQLHIIDADDVTVDFVDNESSFSGCSNAMDGTPDGVTTCASHYSFTLSMK